MRPNVERLSPGQRTLWKELSATPEEFTLYGGVAISLRFGHRFSADFDFFSWKPFDPEVLLRAIPYLKNAAVLQMDSSTADLLGRARRACQSLVLFPAPSGSRAGA